MTSSMAVKAQPIINASKIVMISPTVKTNQLSGQDDNFLRVTIQLSNNAKMMAHHVVHQRGLKRFGVVYDLTNKAFTETWLSYFQEALKKEGGEVVFNEGFTSQQNTRFLPIAKRLLDAEVDGVLFISNAIDTALMAQQIRKLESPVEMYCTEWAFTVDLVSFGGRAVEGMTSFHTFNVNSTEPRYVEFRDKFTKRFGYSPSFATALAYDAALFLFAGLEKQGSAERLKKALLELGTFPGLQSEIKIDKFGDVERKLFLTVVEDGHFQVVE
jgi:branched-chain amino acid transport system substrate-binding protein